ncbi:hypothetical protein HZS55_13485 [Halosimplex rubrum]|uniref:Uncharacterized protein n=1 Tax=Halosimplex rubrum TaxID=869889 RepID=A0A7D5P617_9EURY|nr:hypothetical protein [Halosimplex rubrum]QLH78258.1 hypothetical protein HZS55_13485 [Halosimplex rubrum]
MRSRDFDGTTVAVSVNPGGSSAASTSGRPRRFPDDAVTFDDARHRKGRRDVGSIRPEPGVSADGRSATGRSTA